MGDGMRAITAVDTLQIHTTNACVLQCSGCTHLCGHHKRPYFMTIPEFRKIVESLHGFPRMVGIIGGEPLLSPYAKEQFKILRETFPRDQLGLWSVFPEGEKYARLREDICATFGNLLLNDHTRGDIMHAPVLVASGEYFEDKRDLYLAADSCWVQNSWSPGITPKGAFFCEVAAELDQLFDGPGGWNVSEPGWWKRTPKDYTDQIERSCSKCGCCMPLARRTSQDDKCDISEGNAEILKGRSRKVDNGQIYLQKRGEFRFDTELMKKPTLYPDQVYKQEEYRKAIAARYGIYLTMNSMGYWSPNLMPPGWENRPATQPAPPGLYQIMKARYSTEEVTG